MLERRKKLTALEEAGIEAYSNDFRRDSIIQNLLDGFTEESSEEDTFKVAGRIMALRDHGKSSFCRYS